MTNEVEAFYHVYRTLRFLSYLWLIWMSSLYILDTRSLSVICVANIFFHCVACLFTLYSIFLWIAFLDSNGAYFNVSQTLYGEKPSPLHTNQLRMDIFENNMGFFWKAFKNALMFYYRGMYLRDPSSPNLTYISEDGISKNEAKLRNQNGIFDICQSHQLTFKQKDTKLSRFFIAE